MKLSLISFNVRAAVADDHSSNVNAFTKLGADYGEPESYFIYDPAYNRVSCTVHTEKAKSLLLHCSSNIFYNNKQKADGDKPREDNIKACKKRQRCEK